MKRPLENNQVVFQNYNSTIFVADGNILEIMQLLKRACEALLGSKECLYVLGSVIESRSRSSGYSKV